MLGFARQRKEHEPFNGWCQRVGDAELARLLTEGQPHPLADADSVPTPQVPETDGPVFE